MTKEQLIQNYLDNVKEPEIPYILLLLLAIAITAIIIIVFHIQITKPQQHNMFYSLAHIPVVFGVSALLLVMGYYVLFYIDDERQNLSYTKEWMTQQFYNEYLPTVEDVKYDVVEYQLTDGEYSLTLDTTNYNKIVQPSSVEFIENGDSYVTAKWIDGLSEYGIQDRYFDVTFYLRKN
ncbi:hypothetical protein BK126_26695 [Paenibacillus sp. FSL H7-0326]|uniref:hypothetical protein n=1 Tax=Paenibacillus sp. FSL H7-0326 TaxID=1921144 RepID=UPI00096E2E29|nr:hypothetical protein [Paenibacillus sp. FSL H7-0326]OMC63780.1 hypothetical protein BK126_26695 [Paenibacillus sp. FSL H7-0326]